MATQSARSASEYFALGCAIDASASGRADVSMRAYQIAASMGHVVAEFNMGVCCAAGEGRAVDLVQARVHYASAAERGYANAQYNLAVMLQAGEGGAIDLPSAEQLYRTAAASGFIPACHNLGLLLVQRDPPDWDQAVGLFETAVEGGCVDSLAVLGDHYAGTGGDAARARGYFERASALGHSHAIFALGGFYEAGNGVDTDPGRAARLYADAAAQGYLPAMAALGVCYATALGVDGDPARALELFAPVLEREAECPIVNYHMYAVLGLWGEADDVQASCGHYWRAAIAGIRWPFDRLLTLVARADWDAHALIAEALELADSPDEHIAAVAVGVLAAVRKRCVGCGATGRRFRVCARCHVAKFCDSACLRRAWHAHKQTCHPA